MKITIAYGVSEEKYWVGDTIRISYGLVVFADSKTNGIVFIAASVRDISNSKTRIEQLADLFSRMELSPIHLNDVIADFLAK